MKIKALILDFGFTLFYFREISLERYLEFYKQGLENSVSFLLKRDILKEEASIQEFKKIFKMKRNSFFRESLKTNKEYPTPLIFRLTLEEMIQKGLIENDISLTDELFNSLADAYHAFELEEWIPFPTTKAALERLHFIKDLKLAVLSNHPYHPIIETLLKKHDFHEYFDYIQTSAFFGRRKPDPAIFLDLLEKLGLNDHPSSAIMCGDEPADIMGGNRVGLKTILCERTYKFQFEREIPITNYIRIKNLSEIFPYLE
ncbi:MAG: HAD family hydrolase [Promethearchaeota archaeon]